MKIKNIEKLSEQFIWNDEVGLVTKSLGESAGSQKLYVSIDYVPPGAFSTKYHSHSQQEEFFLVLSGKGILRLNGQEQEVGKDDFIAKPAGKNIAHTFFNSGKEVLVILDVGTRENEDTCYYPDEDVYMQKSNGVRRIFSGKLTDESWSSDPNSRENNSIE
ncbi:cupin domain-containing protein [Clostridium boliviensis]|uniref:Cupin domain-containing protein n=1 Tax=Clostridium boliviensis TaxID=318465 RepID=A0ABU4GH19_9CLOT|nr:cupin domain-containing protein [Clostridium boliviensis]MDW2796915.1 cupin domain-containing protein [Clostridium boliviensis]